MQAGNKQYLSMVGIRLFQEYCIGTEVQMMVTPKGIKSKPKHSARRHQSMGKIEK
jgi:hypothetical protein